ncbi:sigma-70 family RNA polymerase sigma factor [Methylococcus sp. EFPC2]|uniref:sigma-70 family RNA polymerase sigma factor n=1 Tax=Methylococcus sp. EFPC2 TaxID=2812648 RepID=UPI0019689AC9|nr:sigma-70 family RNA polymerase sigma factor [Methylococcus sp. EFPC2]QSA98910.1 sigma-70 family RNA polymerase sigma factor [Methylococcus sp. EFPC2]
MPPSAIPPDDRVSTAPETWLDAYGDYLYRYALVRVQDVALAEDLVQETLLAALKGREGYDGRASERTWLTGILKHKLFDQLRRQYREIPYSDAADGDPADEDSGAGDFFAAEGHWVSKPAAWSDPAKSLENARFWEVLQRCVERLVPRQRQLFVLRELNGDSNEEICKALGISATNAGVVLYRARMSLRLCLEHNGFGEPNERELDR